MVSKSILIIVAIIQLIFPILVKSEERLVGLQCVNTLYDFQFHSIFTRPVGCEAYAEDETELPPEFSDKLKGNGIFYFGGSMEENMVFIFNKTEFQGKEQVPTFFYLCYYAHQEEGSNSEIYMMPGIPNEFQTLHSTSNFQWSEIMMQVDSEKAAQDFLECGIGNRGPRDNLFVTNMALIYGEKLENDDVRRRCGWPEAPSYTTTETTVATSTPSISTTPTTTTSTTTSTTTTSTTAPTTTTPSTTTPTTTTETTTTQRPSTCTPTATLSYYGETYGDRSFALIDHLYTWDEGVEACHSICAELATIESREKADSFSSRLKSLGLTEAWVGAKLNDTDNKFHWRENDELVPDDIWQPKQPDNMDDNEWCMELSPYLKGANDFTCSYRQAIICDFNAISVPQDPQCVPDTSDHSDNYAVTVGQRQYTLFKTPLARWDDADAHCKSLCGHLISAKTNYRMSIIQDLIKKAGGPAVWVGGRRQEGTGQFFWVEDGTPIASSFWADGEPNNEGGYEDCSQVKAEFGYLGNDTPCGAYYSYICDSPAPECTDSDPSCPAWSTQDECDNNYQWMQGHCKQSCGGCGKCFDMNPNCDLWTNNGECNANPDYMNLYCGASCKSCYPAE